MRGESCEYESDIGILAASFAWSTVRVRESEASPSFSASGLRRLFVMSSTMDSGSARYWTPSWSVAMLVVATIA